MAPTDRPFRRFWPSPLGDGQFMACDQGVLCFSGWAMMKIGKVPTRCEKAPVVCGILSMASRHLTNQTKFVRMETTGLSTLSTWVVENWLHTLEDWGKMNGWPSVINWLIGSDGKNLPIEHQNLWCSNFKNLKIYDGLYPQPEDFQSFWCCFCHFDGGNSCRSSYNALMRRACPWRPGGYQSKQVLNSHLFDIFKKCLGLCQRKRGNQLKPRALAFLPTPTLECWFPFHFSRTTACHRSIGQCEMRLWCMSRFCFAD